MGGRLDSIPVEVCLNSSLEEDERVSFACMILEAQKAGTVTDTHIGPWAILVVVARETLYLDCRRSHSKQADMFFVVLEIVGRESDVGAY